MLPCRRQAFTPTAILLAMCCVSATAQSTTTAPDVLYHVHGTVIDGATHKPIARALVTSNDQRLATLTDRDGHFALDVSVPPLPAQYAGGGFQSMLGLQARRPGYFQKSQPPPIDLAESHAVGTVELKLMPAGTITGRVSASRSDSPENVRITLLRRQLQEGLYSWQQAANQSTDARGQFQFSNLEAGEYTVLTGTWRDPSATTDVPAPTGQAAGAARPIEQYPAVYNGDVATLAAATLLHLHFGQALTTELHLHPAAFYPVTIPVTLPTPTSSVNAILAGGDGFKGLYLRYNQQTHNLQGQLPDGTYTLLLSSYDRVPNNNVAANQRLFASVNINVADAPVRAAAVALAPSSALEVHVQTQFTQNSGEQSDFSVMGSVNGSQQARPPLNFYLRPIEAGVNYGGNQQHPTNANTLLLENVQPGRYAVMAQPFRGYIASMKCGGVDLLAQPLVVHGGTMPPIEILLLDNSATVSGALTGLDSSASSPSTRTQYYVLLFSTDGAGRQVVGFQQQPGKYAAYNVPPGAYRAFAFTGQMPQLPYREPDGLSALDGKGQTLTVAAGQKLQLDLPLVDADELAAAVEAQ